MKYTVGVKSVNSLDCRIVDVLHIKIHRWYTVVLNYVPSVRRKCKKRVGDGNVKLYYCENGGEDIM